MSKPLDHSNLPIAVNIRRQKGKVNGPVSFAEFDEMFLSARDLAVSVWRGHAFCSLFNGSRKSTDFVGSWHMCLDFDDGHGWTLDTIRMQETVARFGSFVHTTTSHTEEAPRLRVVFLMEKMIPSIESYKMIAAGLNAIFPNCETVATGQANKIWSGAVNCEVNPVWSYMPRGLMAELWEEGKRLTSRPKPEPVKQWQTLGGGSYDKYIERCLENASSELASCGAGNRNVPLNKVAYSLFQLAAATWNELTPDYVMSWLESKTDNFWGGEHRPTAESAMQGGMANPQPEPENNRYRIHEV